MSVWSVRSKEAPNCRMDGRAGITRRTGTETCTGTAEAEAKKAWYFHSRTGHRRSTLNRPGLLRSIVSLC